MLIFLWTIVALLIIMVFAITAWGAHWKALAISRANALDILMRDAVPWTSADSLKEVEVADRDVPGDMRGLVWQATAKEYERAQRILRANDREAATAFINENTGRRTIRKSLMFGMLYQQPAKGEI